MRKPFMAANWKLHKTVSEAEAFVDVFLPLVAGNKTVDIRVSTLPTIFGEKVVMRILDPTNLMLDLTDLGFEERALADFETVSHVVQ